MLTETEKELARLYEVEARQTLEWRDKRKLALRRARRRRRVKRMRAIADCEK